MIGKGGTHARDVDDEGLSALGFPGGVAIHPVVGPSRFEELSASGLVRLQPGRAISAHYLCMRHGRSPLL
jgi:hypothetical protein